MAPIMIAVVLKIEVTRVSPGWLEVAVSSDGETTLSPGA
jgi:hypothetical protein